MSKSFLEVVEEALKNIDEVDVFQLKKSFDDNEDFLLIDTRETEEWNLSRIPNATHISKGLIEKVLDVSVPDRNKKIVLYCQSGFRSVLACESIKRLGYNDVSSLKGGIAEWQNSGFDLEI